MLYRPSCNAFVTENVHNSKNKENKAIRNPTLLETASPPSPPPSALAQTKLWGLQDADPWETAVRLPGALFIHLTPRTFFKVTLKMQSGVFTAALRYIL